jgi:hypothetical protein
MTRTVVPARRTDLTADDDQHGGDGTAGTAVLSGRSLLR